MKNRPIPTYLIRAKAFLFNLIVFGSWGALGYLGYRWVGWWGPVLVSVFFVVFHSLIASIVEGWLLDRIFRFRASDVMAQSAAATSAHAGEEALAEPDKAIVLAYRSRPGVELEYEVAVDVHTKIFEAGQPVRERRALTELALVQQTLEIREDGTIKFALEVIEGNYQEDEGPRQKLESVGKHLEMVMRPDGEILECTEPLGLEFPTFPREALKKGDTWERDAQLGPEVLGTEEGNSLDFSVTNKLIGFERDERFAVPVAEILAECQVNPEDSPIYHLYSAGYNFFAFDEGVLVSSDVETTVEVGDEDLHTTSITQVHIRLRSADFSGKSGS